MTDMITAEEAEKLLDGTTPGLTDHCLYHCGKRVAECPCMRDLAAKHALATAAPDLARTVIALHAQLADAQAAQAMVVERCAGVVKTTHDLMNLAMPGDWNNDDGELLRALEDDIRDLAPIDGLAMLAELRAERDAASAMAATAYGASLNWEEVLSDDALWQAQDDIAKSRVACMTAEADRDRLAAASAVLEAKVGRLVEAVIRVKPLDWQEGRFCGQDMFYAETPSGTWMVVCYSGRGFRWAVCDSQGNNSDEDWSTPELAKAAAQGDYDAEVRAALDLTTGPEQTSGWQPIETAPKDGLIDIWLSEGQRWCDCYYDRICDEWRTSRPSGKLVWIKAEHVTHWRPRTPAPAALATQEAGT